MTATVLSLIPATRSTVGTLKTTLAEAAKALDASVVTVALRDNGPKVNGTLVFIEGSVGAVGDVVNARSARNKIVYGPHLILATVAVAGDELTVTGDLDVTGDTKAALFSVASSETAAASALVAAAAAEVAGTLTVKRAKDGEVVATGVTAAEAEVLIAKARSAKKAALVVA